VVNITPYIIDDSAGPRGIIGDTLQEISRQTGHDIKVVVLPWVRALEWVRTGKIDAITPIFKTAAREEFLDFPPVPLATMDLVLMARKNMIQRELSLEEMTGLSILKVRKVSLGDKFDRLEAKGNLDLFEANTTAAAVKMLAAGRGDIFVTQKVIAAYAAKRAGVSRALAVIGKPFDRGDAYLAFSKKSPHREAKNDVFKSLQSLYSDGYVRAVEARYLSYEHVNIYSDSLRKRKILAKSL